MEIIEQAIVGKKNQETCEDAIVVTDSFVAVIDGSTSKGNLKWDGKKSGFLAKSLIAEAIKRLPHDANMQQVAKALSQPLADYYASHNLMDEAMRNGQNRLTASCVIFSVERKEIWMFGDCQCSIDGELHTNEKLVDKILAEIRSDILSYFVDKGKTEDELRNRDLGREFILDALRDQCSFQNNPNMKPYAYTVVDGMEMDCNLIPTIYIGEGNHEIVLASDGFPFLCNTLAESTARLNKMLAEDPLCYKTFKATKGKIEGQKSFDDRAYIRFRI